ncbi:MAG: hybrid sensor histidine kinase/response regulator [Gammaproteobacteria bacterium]|nr:hybrid sensor histidine kinase/response regulator [Gammaproteobacteria bacterium]
MSIQNKSFLIVDDFDAMRKIIKNALTAKGFKKFEFAENGFQALQILKSKTFDLVISDWNMPVMTGLDMLSEIRKDKKLCHLPVLMVTAETKQENIVQAITAGVNEFMVKPFTPATLYTKIESIFAGKSPIQSARSLPGYQEDNNSFVNDLSLEQTTNNINNSLPIKQTNTSAPAPIRKNDKPEILIVDDLTSNIDIIVGFLKGTYKLRIATRGQKAIEMVESDHPPDLILLDIMMPEMDGIEVCKRLKSNPLVSHIPIIFLTAKTDKESLIEAFESGGIDYITKPVQSYELKSRVQSHLELKLSQDALKGQVDTLMENARLRDDVERMSRHDLKTPISSLITLSGILKEENKINLLGNEFTDNLEQIESTSFLLMDMVNQSLNLFKIETGSYVFNPSTINIKDVINKVIKDVNLLADSLEVIVKPLYDKLKISCSLEDLLCYSLFSNIIKNAVEASEKGDEVKVDIRRIDENVIIKVNNKKIVPEEIRSVFFSKYVTHGKSQGTGIGTYSSKLLTEVQNGTIEMDTDEEHGTTISVIFPCS